MMRLPSRLLAGETGLGDRGFDLVELAVRQRFAAEQVVVRAGRVLLEQVADADDHHGQQQPGRDSRAGRHRPKQVGHLSDRLIQKIHPWTLWGSKERGAWSQEKGKHFRGFPRFLVSSFLTQILML